MKTPLRLLLPLFLLVLTACPSDTKEDNPTPNPSCQLKEQLVTKFGNEKSPGLYQYTYNNQNQLVAVTLDSVFESSTALVKTFTLSYDSQGRLKQLDEVVSNEVFGRDSRLVYEYNAQNQLQNQTRYVRTPEGNFKAQDYYSYSYNAANERTQAQYYYLVNGAGQLYYTWKYAYTNGNPVHVTQHSAQEQLLWSGHYTYDNKPALLTPVPFEFLAPTEFMPGVNNMLTANWSSPQGGANGYTMAYTYNEQGFATSAVRTYQTGQTDSSTSTYNCK